MMSQIPISEDALLQELERDDARNDLLSFIQYTNPDYSANWHHKLICKRLDEFMRDPDKSRLMVFVGPRRGKSEIVSRRFPAYFFGHNPDAQIIATSYGADLAQRMNRDVQRVIDSPQYQELFPETQLSGKNVKTSSLGNYVRTSDLFEIVGRKGAYRSAGVGGGITGQGADLALIDDPLKDMAEAMSATRKQVIWDWYTSTLYTRLSKVGKVVIILTRWAEDDLAGRLLKEAKTNGEADQWDILCFPEEYDPDHPYADPDDPRTEKGEILWPEWFPEEKVKKTKASVGSKVWGSLFQQSPAPDGGAIFKSQWFQYFKEPPEFEYICSSWDCAFKDSASSDFVAGGVWGVAGANKYLIYLIRERLSFVDTVKEMLRVHNMFPNQRFMLVEDKANGPAVVSTLKNKIPALITYSPKESKESRANAVSPQYEAGNIWLPDKYYEPNRSRHAWCMKHLDDYIEEHKNFPFGGNDDTVDMTTQFLLKVGNVPSWLDELARGKETDSALTLDEQRTKQFEQSLMEKMGWDADGGGSGFGLDF
jgi:predicted phage terminase large subunit-like protein